MKIIPVIIAAAILFSNRATCGGAIQPIPGKVKPALTDELEPIVLSSVKINGYIGKRIDANWQNRLLNVEEEPLLAGFKKRPGSHPWIGEHIGKWMHAATLAWVYTRNPQLKEKLHRVAAQLISTQEPDGYLGTYLPDKRFGLYPGADWDVWVHKYVMIGLLTYYQHSGNTAALEASKKVGDLLINTFGPGKKNIISAGTHVGMAATSVLEPVVMLYNLTGDKKYLEFALYIVDSWDSPGGPAILKSLLSHKNVSKTANGKAYEMLSNLVGLCELARITGEPRYLQAAINAWEDITARRLYITGSASQGEYFRGDFELPNNESAHVAETCVTVTWCQLNLQLLRLTGEARYANELERTIYNHLAAAQRLDGAQWCYFTALEGRKLYGPGINCCVSSGPRGMALAPLTACLIKTNPPLPEIAISSFETAEFTPIINGEKIQLIQQSKFPYSGQMSLKIKLDKPLKFVIKLRQPLWAEPLNFTYNGKPLKHSLNKGWAIIEKTSWNNGDTVEISFNLNGKLIPGEYGNKGLSALMWGPFVLSFDRSDNPELPSPSFIAFAETDQKNPVKISSENPLRFTAPVNVRNSQEPLPAVFRTFADAGSDGGYYRGWLRSPGSKLLGDISLLIDGREERSRQGNVNGSIIDGDKSTFVVTFNGKPAVEDWYAVVLNEPVVIKRVAFSHGHTFHDGGWFDTAAGKPLIQIKRTAQSQWETVATLTTYPDTTPVNSAGLKDGQTFVAQLEHPIKVIAVRILGKPACGDNPAQAFSSCAELEAFDK